jgi:hypothetical protein
MKEVQVVGWCDGEHPADARVRSAVERNEQGYVLDLCEACDALFEKDLDTVRAWLQRGVPESMTQPPKRSRAKSTGPRAGIGGRKTPDMSGLEWRTCPEGCIDERTGQVYEGPTRTALGQHLVAKHNTKLGDYEWPLNL